MSTFTIFVMEVKAAEFARMAGVSRMAISGKIKNGTLILNSGGKLDTDNPLNRAYLDKHREKQKAALQAKELERTLNQATEEIQNSPATALPLPERNTKEDLKQVPAQNKAASMLNMTIGDLIKHYGDVKGIGDYAKILRDLTAADEREQKTQERRMLQIPKDFVVARLFSFVDQLMNKLLDVPEAVSDQVIALALSSDDGTRRQEVINVLSDNLTRCIAGCKEHIISELNGLKGKYDKTEDESAAVIADLNDKLDLLQGSTKCNFGKNSNWQKRKKTIKPFITVLILLWVAQRLRRFVRKHTDTAELCTQIKKVWKWLLSNGEKLFYTSALLIIQTEVLQA